MVCTYHTNIWTFIGYVGLRSVVRGGGGKPVCGLRAQKRRLPLKSRKYHTDMHADIARLLVMCVNDFYYYYVFNLNNHFVVGTYIRYKSEITRLYCTVDASELY